MLQSWHHGRASDYQTSIVGSLPTASQSSFSSVSFSLSQSGSGSAPRSTVSENSQQVSRASWPIYRRNHQWSESKRSPPLILLCHSSQTNSDEPVHTIIIYQPDSQRKPIFAAKLFHIELDATSEQISLVGTCPQTAQPWTVQLLPNQSQLCILDPLQQPFLTFYAPRDILLEIIAFLLDKMPID